MYSITATGIIIRLNISYFYKCTYLGKEHPTTKTIKKMIITAEHNSDQEETEWG